MSDSSGPSAASSSTLYDRAGGSAWFEALTERFYGSVATDPVLRPLYPADLSSSRRWLCAFLIQYWGGPADYSQQRGHPRLRMRHARFVIGPAERDAWYRHMAEAVEAGALDADDERQMLEYFAGAANHLINAV